MTKVLFKLVVVGTRLFLGLIFFTAGMAKLTHGDFLGIIGPVWLEESLAAYNLGLWVRFVAWSQVVIGLLLLSQRFATLGAIMLLPLISNILMVTISLGWQGTPYVNAFLLVLNLFLLAADHHKIKFLFFDDASNLHEMPFRRNHAKIDALWIGGTILCLGAGALHPISRWLTYGFAGAGILLFLACAIWQYFLERKNLR